MEYKNEYWGGKREGAGRKKIGVSKPVKITLPQEEWDRIEEAIRNGKADSISDYFRRLHTDFNIFN